MYASIRMYVDIMFLLKSSSLGLDNTKRPTIAGKTKARRKYTVTTSRRPTQGTPKSSGFSVMTFNTFVMPSIKAGQDVGAVLMTSRFLGWRFTMGFTMGFLGIPWVHTTLN